MSRRLPHGDKDARYFTFLSLSGDGVARFEVVPPLALDASEDEQVDHILRCARVVECNELFAGLYGRIDRDMIGLAMGDFVPPGEPARLQGLRAFVRSGYRLLYSEEEHTLGGGATRWMGASAFGSMEDGKLYEFWICLRELTARKRVELERERRGRILEAVAFSAARLLQPGTWRTHADEVLARLGEATQATRIFLAELGDGPGGEPRFAFRFGWSVTGVEMDFADPRVRDGWQLDQIGLGRMEQELRAGRPFVSLVRDLREPEQLMFRELVSKSFAIVPIFAHGRFWGFLGFDETRYEREWSAPEVEALKAAATLLGAAIERESADAALRESEERFARLSAAAFEGIAVTEGGVFVDGNEQLARMLGAPLGGLIGRPVGEFVAPEERERVQARIASGSEEPYQHLALRSDGTSFPVEVSARSLPYRDRALRVSALRDVSARVRAEELQRRLEAELRHAAEEWRQTFDALDLGIVLADADARVVRLNRGALEEAAQSSFAAAAGLTLQTLARREPWRTLLDLHRRVGETSTSHVAQALEPTSGRSFYLLGRPWFRGAGEPPWRVLTFRDVTAGAAAAVAGDGSDGLARGRRRARGPQPPLQHLGDRRRDRGDLRTEAGVQGPHHSPPRPGGPPHPAHPGPAGLRPAAGAAARADEHRRDRAARHAGLLDAAREAAGGGSRSAWAPSSRAWTWTARASSRLSRTCWPTPSSTRPRARRLP